MSTEDVRRIEHALEEAADQTALRIVVAVAESSGRYDRPEDFAGFLLGLLGAAAVWLVLPDQQLGSDSWAGFSPTAKIFWMGAVLLAGSLLGTLVAARWWPLRRVFTPRREMRDGVDQAAAATFATQLGRAPTSGDRATPGLLIYLSFYERRASLLTDAAPEGLFSQAALETQLRDLTLLLRQGDPAEAVCQTIRRVAQATADPLPPRPPASPGEANRLVIL